MINQTQINSIDAHLKSEIWFDTNEELADFLAQDWQIYQEMGKLNGTPFVEIKCKCGKSHVYETIGDFPRENTQCQCGHYLIKIGE